MEANGYVDPKELQISSSEMRFIVQDGRISDHLHLRHQFHQLYPVVYWTPDRSFCFRHTTDNVKKDIVALKRGSCVISLWPLHRSENRKDIE